MSLFDAWMLAMVAFAAGALNAVAGGGSFLTLPALVYFGLPAVAANATGMAALLPGYLGGAWGYRQDVHRTDGMSVPALLLLSASGGAAGAALLVYTSEQVFRQIVPWLVLFATVVFALAPKLQRLLSERHASRGMAIPGLFVVAVYGGYFNGGLGILLLALFAATGQMKIPAMNALKNVISAVLTAIAVGVYLAAGLIAWREALVMAASAAIGGYVGAHQSRRIPEPVLRAGIVTVGLAIAAMFFAR